MGGYLPWVLSSFGCWRLSGGRWAWSLRSPCGRVSGGTSGTPLLEAVGADVGPHFRDVIGGLLFSGFYLIQRFHALACATVIGRD